jgi:hypothetical protein
MSLYMDDSFIAENDYLTKLRLFQALKWKTKQVIYLMLKSLEIYKKKTFGFFPRKKVRDCLCKVVKLYDTWCYNH